MMKYKVMEIFDSVQGEGFHMGKPCTFIRLAGCNLRCPWCDTKESWDAVASMMSADDIVNKVNKHMVVITGGEPTIQKLTPLLKLLHRKGHYIALETNGTNDISENDYELINWITVSPKPLSHYVINIIPSEIKFVCDRDFFKAHEALLKKALKHNVPIWIQPEGFSMEKSAANAFLIVSTLQNDQIRMGVQMHKIFTFK